MGAARDIGPRSETTRTQSATACTIVDLTFERRPRLGQVVCVRAGEGTAALRTASTTPSTGGNGDSFDASIATVAASRAAASALSAPAE